MTDETLEEEIVGYRLKPHIDRYMVDKILKNAMPIWNDNDKSVYFIRGHVAGSLVAKLKELQVLDLWFIPIYESEEVESDWIKEHHLEYYYKKGIMSDKSKQETLKETLEQAERSYSEEEVWNICNELASYFIGGDTFDLQKWFEQFKK